MPNPTSPAVDGAAKDPRLSKEYNWGAAIRAALRLRTDELRALTDGPIVSIAAHKALRVNLSLIERLGPAPPSWPNKG